ncbi:MAG: IS110 family transposase [Thermomicrobiales bacterium]|nr:IS110 family transposase [Thermomicrobiales bacterium]
MGQDNISQYVGCDVHKETITLAVATPGREPAQVVATIPNRPEAVRKIMAQLGDPTTLEVAYEAGACGYTLQRQLTRMGITCVVIAPSLVPKRPGDRVKTDRRDACQLAALLRGGYLTTVWVPDEADEALRDLVRARHAARQDVTRMRHRISGMLLRLDVRPAEGVNAWTGKHRSWLHGLVLPHSAQQTVLREHLGALAETEARLERLELAIATAIQASRHAELAAAYQALRGIELVTAATLVVELGDPSRFDHPRELMRYVGLTPTEASSGDRRRQGGISKAGNTRARHVLVEAAHHAPRVPAVSKALATRQRNVDPAIIAISAKAQRRLHRRYWRLVERGKPKPLAVTAVARELVGVLWAIGQVVAEQRQAQFLATTAGSSSARVTSLAAD